jgi:putative tricarboxylic transport membrane protein
MRRFPLYCNLFWILFSLITCVESYRLKLGAIQQPGPGFFPFSAGLLMLILSLAALFQLIKKKNDQEKKTRPESFRWWNIVIILGAIAGYAFFLEKVGFLISSFLFICLLLKVVEPQPWRTAILGGLITAVASNLVFNVIFRAQIPSGIFGF